jgi:DnaA family protein
MSGQLALGLTLRDSARFENFLAGPNPELLGQLRAVARGEGEHFVMCWGAGGVGKTHLLQACCQSATAAGRDAAYLSLGDADALQPAVLEHWERFALVCIDDVDAIGSDRAWEEALFHLYNRIREQQGSLVVSAAAAPAELPLGLPDLVSRLSWGLVYQVRPLDDDQRRAALQLRARQRGCDLPDETASYLLRRLPRDLPALFDLLDQLDQASLVEQRRLTVPFVRSVLAAADHAS